MSRFGDLKRWAYTFPVRWVCRILPVRVMGWVGRMLAVGESATIRSATKAKLRRKIAGGIGASEDSPEARQVAAGVIRHFVWNAIEYGNADVIRRRVGPAFAELPGKDAFEAACAEGRGVVLVGGHTITPELAPAVPAWLGHRTFVIEPESTQPGKAEGFLVRAVREFRLRHQVENLGYETIWTGVGFRRAFRELKSGGVVIIGIDVPPETEGVPVTFLNAPRLLPLGPAFLAYKSGAAVFLSTIERLEFGRNRFTLTQIQLPRTADEDADMRNLTLLLGSLYEAHVRRVPEQWAWLMWSQLGDG